MNASLTPQPPPEVRAVVAELRPYWAWLVVVGFALIVLGLVALGCLPFVTAAYVIYLGFVLIVSGVINAVQALRVPVGGGFFLMVFGAILDFFVGLFMINHVGEAAILMTLLLAVYFMVGGAFRAVVAVAVQYPGWMWTLLAGVASLLLGAAIWKQWPFSGFWVIGLFIGIELLFRGWALVMLGVAVRAAPESR